MDLSEQELEKYDRHFLIDGFSEVQQKKLQKAKMLVIGAGGLGSPVLLYLAAAGAGTIGIVENDQVALSNLPRQILFSHRDVGLSKADLAGSVILEKNPDCHVLLYRQRWNEYDAEKIASDFDMIIDCTDNFQSRLLSDKTSRKLDIPFIYGAVYQMEGQVSVFNYRNSRSYADFLSRQEMSSEDSRQGILGPAAGVVGNLQAAEAIKIITGIGEVLAGKMLFFSLRYNRFQLLNL